MSNTERHGCFTMHPGHIQVPYSFRSACYRDTATSSRTPASTAPVCADKAAVSCWPGGDSVRPAAGRSITQRSAFLAAGTGLSWSLSYSSWARWIFRLFILPLWQWCVVRESATMPTIATPRRMSAKVEESGGGKGSTFSAQVPLTQRQLSVLLKLISTIPHCKYARLGVSYASVSLCAPPKKNPAVVPVPPTISPVSFRNGIRVNVLVLINKSCLINKYHTEET